MTIGSFTADRMRLDQILGRDSASGLLLQSASTLTPRPGDRGFRASLLAPELSTVWNSALPFSLNDGALWAGRGWNFGVRLGAQLAYGPVRVILAPEFFHQQNEAFQTIAYPNGERSQYASPWHTRPESIDLPSRFGAAPFWTTALGQSSLIVDAGPIALGAATENEWWGPGIRNAIVMSDNAAGIPHLFLRTRRPINTPVGTLEGRWMVGRLDESAYFDTIGYNDHRSISALALVLKPAFDRDLSLGVARAVYAPYGHGGIPLAAAFDVLRDVGRPDERSRSDLLREPGPDQIFSLFGRWVLPESGFETYAEWARYEEPASLRDFLELPNHSQGYTLGLQWARPVGARSLVRLQAEATDLEPSSTYLKRRVISWYASRPVEQGYTQRGQVIGASIGPGASSQWLAADWVRPGWHIGAFAGRIRWETAAFYESLPPPTLYSHDVSIFAGVRGGVGIGPLAVQGELSAGTRFNYLFQNPSTSFEPVGAVDIRTYTFRLTVGPRSRPRGG